MNKLFLPIKFVIVSGFVMSVFLSTFHLSEAKTVVRTGEAVSLAEDQTVEGDFYAGIGTVSMSGTVSEDAVVAAGRISVNGSVGDDALLVGGSVEVHGTVGDDLRVLAGDVTIADPVGGDLFVIGGSVSVLSTASIAGDILLYGGEVTIDGSVSGSVMGTAGQLRINNKVGGNVDVTVNNLVLGDKAEVAGSVRYVSDALLDRSPNSIVSGDILRSDPVLPRTKESFYFTLMPFLVLLFATLSWFLVSRRSLSLVVDRSLVPSAKPAVLGFVAIVMLPLAISILMASMIGAAVSMVLLTLYVLLIVLSFIAVPAVLGGLLFRLFTHSSTQLSLLSIIVGIVGLIIISIVPPLNIIVILAFVLITLGALVDILIEKNTKYRNDA